MALGESSLNGQNVPSPSKIGSTLIGIPAYNEEDYIGIVLQRLENTEIVDEILVLDDGSDDRTPHIAANNGAKILKHEKNQGKGVAVKKIIEYARKNGHDYLVLMDADGQHDPSDLPRIIYFLKNSDADIVVGTRCEDWKKIPSHRRWGLKILNSLIPGGKQIDTQCGFRGLNKRALNELELTEKGFTVESEMIIKAKENSLNVKSVKISCNYEEVPNPSTYWALGHFLTVFLKVIWLRIRNITEVK